MRMRIYVWQHNECSLFKEVSVLLSEWRKMIYKLKKRDNNINNKKRFEKTKIPEPFSMQLLQTVDEYFCTDYLKFDKI